jgi:CHAT domain-containing protein/Flp pilus assembly protein TadD
MPQVYEPDVAMTLNNLGNVLSDLRRLEEAEGAYREALGIYRRLADKEPQVYEPYVAATLNNLGSVLRDLRRLEEAEGAFREALEIYRRLAEEMPQVYEPDVAATLNNLGNVLSELRRLEEAEGAYREALEIRRRLADKEPQVYEPDVAMTLNNLGDVLRDLRRLEEAEGAFREALEIYRRHDVPDQRAVLLSNLGRLQMEQERWEEAVETLREAVEQVERLRAEVLNLDRRERILRENIHIYERLLIGLMKLRWYREALEVAERGKSRTLIDLLTLRDLRPHNAPPEVVEEYEQMLFRARALEDALRRTEGDGRRGEGERGRRAVEWERMRQELTQTHNRLRELTTVIREHDPDFLPHAKPLTVDEIIALARDANATLVLFRVTEAGSFVFLVFPDGETDVVEVPDFTTAALNELLVKFEDGKASDGWVVRYYEYQAAYTAYQKASQEALEERNRAKAELAEALRAKALHAHQSWLGKMDETLGMLYRRLLKPVHERLKGWQRRALPADHPPHLVLVPNRGLAILPLHACWWEEGGVRKYLLDEFVIRYAPSLSVFKRCLERERAGRKRETLLGVANPVPPGNLVFSEWECEEIERLIGNERCLMLWREKATEAEVRQWMRERNYLHFSCHGQYRLDAPLESSLRLAGVDALTLGEILEGVYLPRAWLVVLSACETGLVDFREVADEHFGLPTGFLYAGAPTVYGSLWSVNDLSTALLMVKVYEGLEREGKSKPEALRDAQIWLRDLMAREALTLVRRSGERMAWADVAPLRRALEWSDPHDRPFAHPYWWAGFQCVGV